MSDSTAYGDGSNKSIQMFFLPKFLYILSNSPVFVLKQVFRLHCGGFSMGISLPRVFTAILKLPINMGGINPPGLMFLLFCISIVFPTLAISPQIPNATTFLDAVVATSQTTLLNMVYSTRCPG